jgi:hypothetical protein
MMAGGKKSGPKVHGSSKGLGAKSDKLLGTREQDQQAEKATTLIRQALKEKDRSKVEDQIRNVMADFLKSQNMGHVKLLVNLKGMKEPEKVEKYVASVIDSIAKASPTLFKEGIDGINIVSLPGLQEEHNRMVKRQEDSFFNTYTPGTKAEVVSQFNFDPDNPKPHNMYLNVYTDDRVPNNLDGMIAHELAHVMEKKWADSLFQDYVMVKTGGRHVDQEVLDENGQVVRDEEGQPIERREVFPKNMVDGDTRAALKMLQDKCKNDPNFKKQMAFVKDWEKVSAYEIVDMESNIAGNNGITTVKDWTYNPDRIAVTKQGITPQDVVMDAFNLNPPVANYVHGYGRTRKEARMAISPAEELAEAVRVAKDPQFEQHMSNLERTNPDAKRYLEGLLGVIAKYDDVIKDRLMTVSKNPDVLKEPAKRRRKTANLEDEAAIESQSQRAKKGSTIPF